MKLKITVVVGTRPELIRLSRVMHILDQFCNLRLLHTGQNYDYELNGIFFDELKIRKPDKYLDASGHNAAQTIANVISTVDQDLRDNRPEAFLVLGDTNSCLAAISAKRQKIPCFHMEAGNRCYDQRVPEELNRKIVDHVCDINLTYSHVAREFLIAEGFSPQMVINIGSPMFEVLNHYKVNIEASTALDDLDVRSGQYFLCSFHREENVEDAGCFENFRIILNKLANKYKYPILVSTHPRTRKKLEISIAHGVKYDDRIKFLKPLGFFDYNKLQCEAACVLSDSGTISEEASILNFNALNLRESHERLEAMEEAAVMMVGLNLDRIIQAIDYLITDKSNNERRINLPASYSVDNVSIKVLKIIMSHIDYVNKVVWKKN